MDIYVFNKEFEPLGIIDSFTSFIWRREFYKTGTFELHLSLPDKDEEAAKLIALLRKDQVLLKEDSPEEAAYIDTVVIDDEENETLVVSGFFVENFFKDRLVWGEQSKAGSIESILKHFVSKNCIQPDKTNRIIPHLTLSPDRGITKQVNEVDSYGNLVELIEELSLKYDVGWRVLFNLATKQYIFDVYDGMDRTINQSANPRAIFSLQYENVKEQSFTDSNSNYKNMALIAGQGEGSARKLVTINDHLSGFERRELFVDARDLPPTRESNVEGEDDIPLTDAEYEMLLIERGNSGLAETQIIKTFESGIYISSNLVYKQDFDLGDKVTIQNDRWGLILNTRITSVEEVYENDIVDIRVNFGSNIPTLIDKIQQKTR
ncbi:siphovirus ReqiPepy6 Gp37-like family protein [Peribacillus psychrosaccharolyticus]|uniref:siphovirus ReqiPepy6 Gp37-like family protein n=1 Tax=Peribacillus psychrosaccharolyticus TaxID=1407 RepID=UPI003D2E5A15